MKFSLLSLFFLSLGLRAQILSPGTYHHLRPTGPMVLDTGSFTFVDLEMKNLGEGLWLDARKAKLLELQSCKFENTKRGKATAILVHGSLKIHNSTIRNMDCGIKVLGNNNTLSIHQNTFENLSNAVWLQSGTHTLSDFRCNNFIYNLTGSGNQGVGLFVGGNLPGQGAPALAGPIGGNGLSGQVKPNGNVWPVDQVLSSAPWPIDPNNTLTPAQLLAAWKSPVNWISIRNDNPDPLDAITYWAFDNEFVSSTTSPNVIFPTRLSNQNRAFKVLEGSTLTPPLGVDYIPLCSGDLPNVFPLRIAVNPTGEAITKTKERLIDQNGRVHLGDAIPNPAEHSTTIPVFIPELSKSYYNLELFDLQGKRVHLSFEIKEKGTLNLPIDLSGFLAGVYGFRLLENGKSVGTRKLVILK